VKIVIGIDTITQYWPLVLWPSAGVGYVFVPGLFCVSSAVLVAFCVRLSSQSIGGGSIKKSVKFLILLLTT
jgi:hypothetical protein